MQYLVPTPDGEQPDLELAFLVVDGEFIPADQVRNAAQFSIVTVEQSDQQDQTEAAR